MESKKLHRNDPLRASLLWDLGTPHEGCMWDVLLRCLDGSLERFNAGSCLRHFFGRPAVSF